MPTDDEWLVMTGGPTATAELDVDPDVQLSVMAGGRVGYDGRMWRLVAVRADGTVLLQEPEAGAPRPLPVWMLADDDWN